MSKALELRGQALMLMAGQGLDLTGRIDLTRIVTASIEPELAQSKDILLVGRSLKGLADRLMEARILHAAKFDVLDTETGPTLLPRTPGMEVRFMRSDLDDYAADPREIDAGLQRRPITCMDDLRHQMLAIETSRRERPMIVGGRKHLVIHDLVANRLDRGGFSRALDETFRVLTVEGCLCSIVLLADEKSDDDPLRIAGATAELRRFPIETEILECLRNAGFHGMSLTLLHDAPVLIRSAVETRAVLVRAYKGTQGPCYDEGHAVIYKGPWSSVTDDDGHVYRRGERTAVCRKTYDLLGRAPYVGAFAGLVRYGRTTGEPAIPFDCNTPSIRSPAVTKGTMPLKPSQPDASCCGDAAASGDGCC